MGALTSVNLSSFSSMAVALASSKSDVETIAYGMVIKMM
jgi:hypothetical protein